MDLSNKGKSGAALPSMAIRFNATAEEIEEIYTKEDEQNEPEAVLPIEKSVEVETSPRRSILPLLGKRSTSVDVSSTHAQDSSPPSDPWRFFSDIKGKIKSVEVKFTEYKARTAEIEGSPKATKSSVKDSKENSSLSDSEEVSESSISRTCGVVSTTEGVEMSSDDETPSLSEEDKRNRESSSKPINQSPSTTSSVRQRFRVVGRETPSKEGVVAGEFLETIQKLTGDDASGEVNDIESGVDALADLNIDNLEVDSENVLNINQVTGSDIRKAEFSGAQELETVFGPQGFVDLRRESSEEFSWLRTIYKSKAITITAICLCLYFILPLSLYVSGFIAGGLCLSVIWCLYIKMFLEQPAPQPKTSSSLHLPSFVQIPSVKEHQPLKKYEGWVNEYPEEYNPLTYHVCQTQPVYLRLQGNFLKVSHTRQKIPKRAMWNEPEHKYVFTRHRIYNLLGAKVVLLPEGLARVRLWSKKYPICVILNKDQVDFEDPIKKVKEHKGKEVKWQEKKTDSSIEMQVYSKLIDNVEEHDASAATLIQPSDSDYQFNVEDLDDSEMKADGDLDEDELSTCLQEWHDVISDKVEINPDETRIYLFGRTGREKEDWFRRLRMAASGSVNDEEPTVLEEYLMCMRMQKVFFGDDSETDLKMQRVEELVTDGSENGWVNAMVARVLFDCYREQSTIQRIKERIQRKLASIRLPYFIQELQCEDLDMGTAAPTILHSSKPVLDDRGLWLDLDISYEGQIVVILQTKVNLLKLKHQHVNDKFTERSIDHKPAIYHSDVDDSAESSTDEEPPKVLQSSKHALDSMGYPVPGIGGVSKGSKKLMKMVDRIAESKFFQAATENRYIKKAMEDFSNTDLRLKVELKKCVGKLAINIPPPPTDRIWLGFRLPPELVLCAQPIVGDRNISFMHVTSWIEKKIYKEFQKVLVIPNMEDLLIPVMSLKLPE